MGYGSSQTGGFHPNIVIFLIIVLIVNVTQKCSAQLEFKWVAGPWGDCEHSSCGPGGRQYREVWCTLRTGHPVLDRNCEPNFKPAGGRECVKNCTGNVILSKPDSYDGETNYSPQFGDYDKSETDYAKNVENQGVNTGGLDFPAGGRDFGGGSWDFPLTSAASDVEWVVSQWSSCELVPGAKSCGRSSGVRSRNVTCERKDREVRVSSVRCENEEPMPVTSQSCELLCRQDCVVSIYSNWSGCDSTCQIANQTQVRQVIVPPRHRGSHCPELSRMRPCANCSHSFTYQFSDWLPCTPISGSYSRNIKSHDMIGYQTREISCLQSKGVLTSLRHCSDKLPYTILKKHKACVIPQDCQVSTWSALRPHNASCIGYDGQVNHGYMIRTRQVLQLPLGNGEPCPSKLIDFIKLNKEDINLLRPCKRAKWIMSSWSLCQSVPGYNHCGTGMQSRRAICVEIGDDSVERPVDEKNCPQPKPLVAQSCTMECNWDCSVSQWSSWSTCQAADCSGVSLRRKRTETQFGKRFRTREILTLPGPGGNACPHLSETRMCEPEPCYRWNTTLGHCEATTRGGCGDGTQLQKAVCINRAGLKVRERFCHESLQSTQNWANCYVPCPEDCVLSEWGTWSACPDPCMVQAGVRSMRSRQRQILAYHGAGRSSRPCPNPNLLRETEPCPILYDCLTYQWEVSTWGPCRLTINNPSVQCGLGTQSRTVECYTSKGTTASDDKCMAKIRPKSSQNCMVECPIDCHVTEWSEWSDCGVKCLPVQARQIYPTQTRKRFILQYPQNGGLTCPSDLKEEQSCFDLPVCQTYYWETTDWSDCVLPPVVPLCGQGLRARNISCHHADERGTKHASISECLENLGTMPGLTEPCYSPCESECQLSPWSAWTQCGPRCDTTRFRYRRLLGDSKNNPDCRDKDRYPRDEHQECMCDNLKQVVGGWSDCIIQTSDEEENRFAQMSLKSISGRHRRTNETGVGGFGPQAYCGKGKKYMALSCQNPGPDASGIPRCAGEEYHEENCSIPCPIDCKTTDWSSWSSCSVRCGAGIQQRERRIMQLPANGGRKCPFMYNQNKETQTKVCHVECSYNVWRAEGWGPCVPAGAKSCGDGTHSQTVRCVSVGYEDSEMTVDDSYCKSEDKPESIKPCSLPCPGECVMSDWSEWTMCTQPCNGQQKQSRVRHVLRKPARYALSRACSDQREERTCERLKNCIEYSWELSDWTSCLVNGGRAECGVGHKERYAICRNEIGEKVEAHRCNELFGPVTEPLVVSCENPCDIDCLTSNWSDWTTCSTTCGLGFTNRRRTVLQIPIGNGRKCPEKKYMDESKPCFLRGCYRWYVSEWSHCIAQNGVCGSGVQERNVSCLNDDGRAVNSSKCPPDPEKLVMQTSRPCQLPCPGECKLSEWSSWSNCFISCEDFEQGFTVGAQARSRAILAHPAPGNLPCNGTLWEDKRCEAHKCSWFSWKTSKWNYATYSRDVYCELNDHTRVVGGCDERQRPDHILRCHNPICVEPAQCRDSNTCDCPDEEGYVIDTVNSTAVTCIMNTTAALGEAGGEKTQVANSPNIWMYAVIAIGTLFVIAVTAGLYNMCELFRTGPRPRRKGESSREASTTGTIHSVNTVHGNGKGGMSSVESTRRSENLYKQINHHDPEDGNLVAETVISTNPSHNSHLALTAPLSRDPQDIPDIDAITTTTTPASSSTVTTAATTTSTSPVNPSHPSRTAERPQDNRTKVGSSKPLKHNRRYKRYHRLLPARVAKCFACEEKSSECMGGDPHANLDQSSVQGQAMSLTRAHAIENMEMCGGEFYTNTASGFQNHSCMLPHNYDAHPTNLDLNRLSHFSGDFDITDASRKLSIPLTVEMEQEIARISPVKANTFPGTSGLTVNDPQLTNTSCRTSSESLAFSSDLVSGKHEGSSLCSLQLGDTAETLFHNDTSSWQQRPTSFSQPPVKHQEPQHQRDVGQSSLLTHQVQTNQPSNTAMHHNKKGTSTNSHHAPNLTQPVLDSGDPSVGHHVYSPLHVQVPPIPPYPVDALVHSNKTPQHSRHPNQPPMHLHHPQHFQSPNSRGKSHSTTSPSPLSFSSDLPYDYNHHHQKSPHHNHQRRLPSSTTTKALVSPLYRGGRGGDSVGEDSKISPAVTTISSSRSFASLPENLVNSTKSTRINPLLMEKVSQDSGTSTIPQSQTVSPDYGGSFPKRSCFSPLHIQTSLESGHDSPTSSLCHSCKREMGRSGTGSFLAGTPESISQLSNISGLETSV